MQLDPGLTDGLPPGNNTSTMLTLNVGALQGCVLSLVLYSLFTHNCVATHDSNTLNFADDMTVVGLITNNTYREEVRDLAADSISLHASKTKELIMDYRKQRAENAPITLTGL